MDYFDEMESSEYSFDDWLNGELEKYREQSGLPVGIMPHIHLNCFQDGVSKKARNYQKEAFYLLSDMLVFLKVDRLFKAESRRAISEEEAVNAQVEFLNELLDELSREKILAVKKGQTDFVGFGPEACQQIMDISDRFENKDLSDDDTWTISRLESITGSNALFKGAVIYKQIKRLEEMGSDLYLGDEKKSQSEVLNMLRSTTPKTKKRPVYDIAQQEDITVEKAFKRVKEIATKEGINYYKNIGSFHNSKST